MALIIIAQGQSGPAAENGDETMTRTLTQADLTRIDARVRADMTRLMNAHKPSPVFVKWFDTLIAEKGINTDQMIEVEGEGGANIMPLEIVIDAIKAAPRGEQKRIKNQLVRLDFLNQPIEPFLRHLAQAIAI